MNIILKEQTVDLNVVDGQIMASLVYSEAGGWPEELQTFVSEFISGFIAPEEPLDEELVLKINVPLTSLLDFETESRQRLDAEADEDTFSTEDKPYFDAIRQALQALLTRIDNFKYID